MTSPLDIARDVLARGYNPIPIPRGKNPNRPGWQNLVITDQNIGKYFNGAKTNVGVQLGPKSSNLADADLDCWEAIALAPYFLPPTDSIYGRKSKRQSHRLFTCSDPEEKASIKLNDENKKVIVELRLGGGGKGAQSVFPGSVHPSGEIYAWEKDGEPARATCATLKAAIHKIAIGTLIVRCWPAEGRNDAAMRVGAFLARAGWPVDDIGNFMVAVQKVAGVTNRDHIENGRKAAIAYTDDPKYGLPALIELCGEKIAARIAKLVGYQCTSEPTSKDDKPVVKIMSGSLSIMADVAEQILLKTGVPFYERSNMLVRPIVKEVDTFRDKKTRVVQLAAINTVYLRDILGRVADWYRFDQRKNKWFPADPPTDVAATMLARSGEWKFPSVSGVITTPTLRPNGTILATPGYDPVTGLLLIDPPPIPKIPSRPTRADARAALRLLEGLLTEFPFVDPVARAVALSTLITPVVRGAFSVTPMHAADAPVAGSGKSYLFDLASYIATGQAMPVISAGYREEETEKRLGSAALAGQTMITIDNVNGELRGDALCQLIERPRPQIRILGKSELINVEMRGSCLFCNGNNIVIVGDLCRRVIRARLDPKLERPELRKFTSNPIESVMTDRGKYIAAALTIARAYIVAGRPNPQPRLASFEGWSDTVRSALVWLGTADPVASMEMSRADDPVTGALIAMLEAWASVFGTGSRSRVTVQGLITKAMETSPGSGFGYASASFDYPELNAAVMDITLRGQPDAKRIGNWLRRNKDRLVVGMRFKIWDKGHTPTWYVEREDGKQLSPDKLNWAEEYGRRGAI